MKTRSILIIEDEHALGTALSFLVRRMGHIPVVAASARAGIDAFREGGVAAVVLDIGLPDMSGLDVLKLIRESDQALPVLVITAHASLDHAIHSHKSGATAYLTKPLDLKGFEQTLSAMLAPDLPMNMPPVPTVTEGQAATLIGAAPCLRETFIGIARACAGDVPALIYGPSGSGKSLVASVIHAHSSRAARPLEVQPCLSIKDMTTFDRPGGGTIVLDEVTDLATDLQAALAAWLAHPPADRVRILATTVHDPRESVRSGLLREDLYYTLSALTIPVPPLSERSSDIAALSSFFVGLRCGASMPTLTPPVLAALQSYPWPGNVRELRHVLEYAVTMSGGGPVFLTHLPSHLTAGASSHGDSGLASGELHAVVARWLDAELGKPDDSRPGYDAMLEHVESLMLRHLLEVHDNRPTRMAAALGMHRATLRQKLRRFGLQRDDG